MRYTTQCNIIQETHVLIGIGINQIVVLYRPFEQLVGVLISDRFHQLQPMQMQLFNFYSFNFLCHSRLQCLHAVS